MILKFHWGRVEKMIREKNAKKKKKEKKTPQSGSNEKLAEKPWSDITSNQNTGSLLHQLSEPFNTCLLHFLSHVSSKSIIRSF